MKCNKILEVNVISIAEHNYVYSVCAACDEINRKPSEGLCFSLSSDKKSYCLSSIGSCTDTDIVIPSEYRGLKVTSINDYAFYMKKI